LRPKILISIRLTLWPQAISVAKRLVEAAQVVRVLNQNLFQPVRANLVDLNMEKFFTLSNAVEHALGWATKTTGGRRMLAAFDETVCLGYVVGLNPQRGKAFARSQSKLLLCVLAIYSGSILANTTNVQELGPERLC
jgi:hypothetical protein